MKTTYAAALVLTLGALTAGQAMADTTNAPVAGKTREQVRAELFEYQAAHRNDVILPILGINVADLPQPFATAQEPATAPVSATAAAKVNAPM